jgi:hypothetical protein
LYDLRYQRGNRSLADNLSSIKETNASDVTEQIQTMANEMDDEDYDIPDIIEEIIGTL